ncbi:MAG: histidine phosphatase family protein [Henriciella sp.]
MCAIESLTVIYLTRHGQTQLNAAGRLQGHSDSQLTTRGISQAHAVGHKLKALIGSGPIDLWISPLGRAQETAAIIESYLAVAQVKTDDRLAEISLGDWEGMTMEDIEFTHPGMLDGSSRFDWAYRAPKGESETAFSARLQSWLAEIEQSKARSVVVSHGWAGMGLRSLYSGLAFEQVSAKGDSHEAVFEFSAGTIREL